MAAASSLGSGTIVISRRVFGLPLLHLEPERLPLRVKDGQHGITREPFREGLAADLRLGGAKGVNDGGYELRRWFGARITSEVSRTV